MATPTDSRAAARQAKSQAQGGSTAQAGASTAPAVTNAVNTNPGSATASNMPNTNPGQTPAMTKMDTTTAAASGSADARNQSWMDKAAAGATGSTGAAASGTKSTGYYDESGKYRTTITGADGKTYSGYIYNGATYYDNGNRIGVGDSVVAADGKTYTMEANKSNTNPNYIPNDLNNPDFQDWLYGEGGSTSSARLVNDYEGYLPQYRTDKYGQDVANGNIQKWPNGTVDVYDGFQNLIGRFDSAGTWHPNYSGDVETSNALQNSWEKTAREYLDSTGYKFTGNGLEWADYAVTSGSTPTINAKKRAENSVSQTPTASTGNAARVSDYYPSATRSAGTPSATPSATPTATGGNSAPISGGGVPANYNTQPSNQPSTIEQLTQILAALGGGQPATSTAPAATETPAATEAAAPTQSGALSSEEIKNLLASLTGEGESGHVTIDTSSDFKAPTAPDLKPLLDEWRTSAEEQQRNSIDYNVQQGITNLQRAEEDAQQGFRTSQEQIAADEMAARDNQALYAEARGDKGGIGAAQYDSIANTAAKNRQSVRDAQVKLSTDTARQIEDLRNQGEFQKADALLQVSQQYLTQLMSLEQWAANYGLTAAQFEESVREWENNFKLNVAQLTGDLEGQKTLAARNADRDYALNLLNYDLNRTDADRNYDLNKTNADRNYELNKTNADRNYELSKMNSDRDLALNILNYDLNKTNADRNFGLSEGNLTGYYNGARTLSGQNADRDYALNEAGLTGYYNGSPTQSKINNDRNFGLSEANVTGYYNGQPTMARTNSDREYELSKTNADRNFALNEANITGTYNGQPTYAAQKNADSALASAGQALLSMGIMPSADQLRAMGYSEADAQSILMAMQAAATAKSTGGYRTTPKDTPNDDDPNKLTRTWQTSSQAVKNVIINAANAAATGMTSYADALESYAREAYGKGDLSKEDIDYIKSLINN